MTALDPGYAGSNATHWLEEPEQEDTSLLGVFYHVGGGHYATSLCLSFLTWEPAATLTLPWDSCSEYGMGEHT